MHNDFPKYNDLTYDYDTAFNDRLGSSLVDLKNKYDRLNSEYSRVSTAYITLSNDYYKLKDKYDRLYEKFKNYKSENAYHNYKDKFVIEFDKIEFDDIVKILDYLKR